MKILHVYKTFLPETKGGGEHVIHTLCKGLQKFGVQSKVLCLSKEKTKTISHYDGIEVIRYPYDVNFASCPISFNLLINFKKEAKWADIVYYHYPWPFADLLSLTLLRQKKQIVTYHSDIVKQKLIRFFYYPLEQLFLSRVNKIIATSPNYANSSKNLKKFEKKTVVVPLATEQKLYPKPQKTECTKLKNKFGDFILFIGQLRYYKGLHLLIEASKEINANILIIGKGKEELKLKQLAKNCKNITFIGESTEQEKVNYISSCYAFILPSHLRSEAFGVSLIEASMFSKPLISCAIGTGVEYVNKHNVSGFVVNPQSRAIAIAANTLLNNKKLAKKMGDNSLSRYNELFTANKMMESIFNILKNL